MTKAAESVGLPPREFLYTLDQIATMLSVELIHLEKRWIHFDGRSVGPRHPTLILAINIAPRGVPEWRVGERELVRWFKRQDIRIVRREFAS